jgi:hypothetical protein
MPYVAIAMARVSVVLAIPFVELQASAKRAVPRVLLVTQRRC